MTEIVILFAEQWHTTPFEILKQDIDDFIMIANQKIKSGRKSTQKITKQGKQGKEVRIKVNDKTATGGWF